MNGQVARWGWAINKIFQSCLKKERKGALERYSNLQLLGNSSESCRSVEAPILPPGRRNCLAVLQLVDY